MQVNIFSVPDENKLVLLFLFPCAMLHNHPLYVLPLYKKFVNVCRRLQEWQASGRQLFTKKIRFLLKKWDNYLKRLMQLQQPTVKTCSIIGLSVLLSTQGKAQECRTFVDANKANPLWNERFPYDFSLARPFFVDIDGDGDLDCYETYPGDNNFGLPGMKILFLRNNGTKEIPYFQRDSADGFNKDLGLYLSFKDTAPQFVDIDNDGDYDCFIGEYDAYYPSIAFFENVGTKTKPEFMKQPYTNNPLSLVESYGFLFFQFVDLDSDSDYDILTSYFRSDLGRHYANVGTATTPVYKKTSSYKLLDPRSTYYDWNKDGLIDYFNGDGYYYKNIGPAHHPDFVKDNTGPIFPAGHYPYQFIDLNNDGFPESFDDLASYATTSPAPIIKATQINTTTTKLSTSPDSSAYTYRWRRNGKDFPNNNQKFIIINQPGIYTAEITGHCGTGVSLAYKFKTNAASFTEAGASSTQFIKADITITTSSIKAYPNPFASQFVLNLDSLYSANTIIKISDVQGRIVSTAKANSTVLQLGSNLQKGVYIVQVWQGNAIVFTQKIIKE